MAIKISNNRITFNDNSYIESANFSLGDGIPSGTRMIFYQTSAPTNWTKITTYNNMCFRVVNGTVGAYISGLSFTSAFDSRSVSGTVSISVSSHNVTTWNTSASISLSNTTIPQKGPIGIIYDSGTVNNSSGTESLNVSVLSGGGSVSFSNSDIPINQTFYPGQATPGMNSHTHSFTYYQPVATTTQINYMDPYLNQGYISYVSSIYENSTINSTTGFAGSGSTHEHQIAPNTLYLLEHNHNNISVSHIHDVSSFTVPVHNHGFLTSNSGTVSFNPHTHTVNVSAHNHSYSLSHSATASFLGNNLDFRVSYVDFIIAEKTS